MFHWSVSYSKSPQFSRTLLSIQVNLNNAIVWMVSTHPVISKSSSPFTNSSVPVPRAPITIGKIVTFIFHCFFCFFFFFQFEELIFIFAFFQFYSVVSRDIKTWNSASPLFLLIIIYLLESFSNQHKLAVFHWSLSDSNLLKSPGLFSVF